MCSPPPHECSTCWSSGYLQLPQGGGVGAAGAHTCHNPTKHCDSPGKGVDTALGGPDVMSVVVLIDTGVVGVSPEGPGVSADMASQTAKATCL